MKKETQSHCDIFRQGDAQKKLIERTTNNFQKQTSTDGNHLYGDIARIIQADCFRRFWVAKSTKKKSNQKFFLKFGPKPFQ